MFIRTPFFWIEAIHYPGPHRPGAWWRVDDLTLLATVRRDRVNDLPSLMGGTVSRACLRVDLLLGLNLSLLVALSRR